MPTTIDIEVSGSTIVDVAVTPVINTVEIDMQPVTTTIEIDFSNTVPGAPGAPGAAGADGADGSAWLRGTGAPSDGNGADGDYYIDDAIGQWYGPKAAGTWTGTGPNAFGVGVTSHGALTGLLADDHSHYSLADGTRWTTGPSGNRLAWSNASANLVESDLSYNGTQLDVGSGNSVWIRDFAASGYLIIGATAGNAGVLSHAVGSPNIFSITGINSRVDITGGGGIILKASGGTSFNWPSADGSAGYVMKTDGLGSLSLADPNALISAATDTTAGKVELATPAEVDTGIDDTRAITPASLAGSYAGTEKVSFQFLGLGQALAVGSHKFPIPPSLDGMNVVYCNVYLEVKGSSGTSSFMLHNATDTADMLTGNITLASGAGGGWTGAGAINTATDDVAALDFLQLDIDTAATGAEGPGFLLIEFRLP